MTEFWTWIIIILILFGFIVYSNPSLIDDFKQKIDRLTNKEYLSVNEKCSDFATTSLFMGSSPESLIEITCFALCGDNGKKYKDYICNENGTLECGCS